jgi:uncharacterized protein YjcR
MINDLKEDLNKHEWCREVKLKTWKRKQQWEIQQETEILKKKKKSNASDEYL